MAEISTPSYPRWRRTIEFVVIYGILKFGVGSTAWACAAAVCGPPTNLGRSRWPEMAPQLPSNQRGVGKVADFRHDKPSIRPSGRCDASGPSKCTGPLGRMRELLRPQDRWTIV